MSKLLQSRLPMVSAQANVDSVTFNKTVRLLEISLDSFDPDATPQFGVSQRDTLKFNAGDIIWNTTEEVLQVYLGNSWQNISTPSTSGTSATGSIGTVSVINDGNITVVIN